MIKEGDLILFQGDSITDAQRKRRHPDDLGRGYVALVNQHIQVNYPQLGIRCCNRGVYGNRSKNLRHRWQKDCLDICPDHLSILIGINDTWRRYDWGLVTTVEQFRDNYHYLLESAYEMNPNLNIILMSPFVLPVKKNQIRWHEDLDPKIEIVKQLAKEYNANYIPLQKIFDEETTLSKPPNFWSEDGVHPTAAGNCLIAKKWIEQMNI